MGRRIAGSSGATTDTARKTPWCRHSCRLCRTTTCGGCCGRTNACISDASAAGRRRRRRPIRHDLSVRSRDARDVGGGSLRRRCSHATSVRLCHRSAGARTLRRDLQPAAACLRCTCKFSFDNTKQVVSSAEPQAATLWARAEAKQGGRLRFQLLLQEAILLRIPLLLRPR